MVLQARGDEGFVQAARRAARLLLLRLRARARLARVPAQLGRSEQAPAHAPGRAREGARWTDDRGGFMLGCSSHKLSRKSKPNSQTLLHVRDSFRQQTEFYPV